MSLNTMPDNILLGILQHIDSWKYYKSYSFKRQLRVLRIFQGLRAVALPRIYNHVYINFNLFKNRKNESYANKYTKTFSEYIDTNADVIALVKCAHMIKSAKIYIHSLNSTFAELNSVIEAIKLCANLWPNITQLEIIICNDTYSSNIDKLHMLQCCRLSKEYCQALANIMPGVTELTLLHKHSGGFLNEFYSKIASVYANQLVKLDNEYDFYVSGWHKFEVMQYLNISIDFKIKELPRVNCHTLVDLHIEDVPFNASWASFMDNENNTVVEFSCLKYLRLHFSMDTATNQGNENKTEIVLNFPLLSSLTISSKCSFCPFLQMARFPNAMREISIQGYPELHEQFCDLQIPNVKSISFEPYQC